MEYIDVFYCLLRLYRPGPSKSQRHAIKLYCLLSCRIMSNQIKSNHHIKLGSDNLRGLGLGATGFLGNVFLVVIEQVIRWSVLHVKRQLSLGTDNNYLFDRQVILDKLFNGILGKDLNERLKMRIQESHDSELSQGQMSRIVKLTIKRFKNDPKSVFETREIHPVEKFFDAMHVANSSRVVCSVREHHVVEDDDNAIENELEKGHHGDGCGPLNETFQPLDQNRVEQEDGLCFLRRGVGRPRVVHHVFEYHVGEMNAERERERERERDAV